MTTKKSDLISIYAQSIGIEAAKELITKKINAAALDDKENYTEEEIARICGELSKEGGLIRIVAQNFLVQLQRRRSEEQALLLNNIETQIWYLTDIETFGAVNKACAEFFGLEQENLEGRNLRDIVGRDEAEVCIASNREVFEKKKQIHTEVWAKNSKGETRLLSVTRTPKLDVKGEVEYVICAAEDITERKQAEDRITHLNSVLKAIRTVNQLIVVEKDRDNLLQKACDALVEARGYDAVWLGLLKDGETFATVKGSGFREDISRFCKHVMEGDHPPCIKNAIAQKDSFVILDKYQECGDCFFKDACVGKEAAVIQVEHAGKLFALLVLLLAFDVAADDEEKELLDEVAGDIAFALHGIEMEEARKQAEKQIKASLKEKEALLQEIHHRVKNNLQIVSSLLSMQARASKDEATVDILTESKNRINAMALIHTQLYESGDLSEINVKRFVDNMLRQMFQAYPVRGTKITPIVRVADYSLPVAIAVPIGLIVNELLSNTFKHAFVNRKEGKIEVDFSVSEKGEVGLTVSDDGVGLPAGFEINTTKTLGLRLVKILAEDQLQGNLEVISREGTTFKILFELESEGG